LEFGVEQQAFKGEAGWRAEPAWQQG